MRRVLEARGDGLQGVPALSPLNRTAAAVVNRMARFKPGFSASLVQDGGGDKGGAAFGGPPLRVLTGPGRPGPVLATRRAKRIWLRSSSRGLGSR